jgi:uncharacterized membrane protein YfcA
MTPIFSFLIIAFIVGIVTAGLNIKFDRFFAIILLAQLAKFSVWESINIFLWILLFGAGFILLKNKDKLKNIPAKNKKNFLTLVPLLSLLGAWAGTVIFANVSEKTLLITIGVLALLYGLRLVFLHFKPHELDYKNEKPLYQKICGFFGPVISGFFAGFVGTTLKPLKIPFAVKLGKMTLSQVYLGNTITAFYASLFAIILHCFYATPGTAMTENDILSGISLWIGIHIMFGLTMMVFKDRWRKPFQIIIGLILMIVAFKFF